MMTSPLPSTSTTAPCGPFSGSSFFRVPAFDISLSSDSSVFRSISAQCPVPGAQSQPPTGHWALGTDYLLVVVFQIPPEAALILDIEHDAGIDRPRIDVHAHGALVPIARILDPVDRLFLVDRVERTAGHAELGGELLHLDARRAREAVHSDDLLVLRPIAADLAVVLDDQLALEHRHPAELAVVRVQRSDRADRPADEHAFEDVVAENLVARVPVGHPQLV